MDKYKEQLKKAVEQVISDGFQRYEYCEFVKKRKREAKAICLYGTGNFYNNYVQNIDKYDYVCDSAPEKWGKYFNGRQCISPEQLYKLESVVVFVMMGNYQDVIEELRKHQVESYFFGDLFLNVYSEHYDSSWFRKNEQEIMDTIDLLEDDRSKEIYTNAICIRIAPQYADLTFHDMEEKGEYFETGILQFRDKECFVDAGAFNGDSIKAFMEAVDGNFEKIYGFELDPHNYGMILDDKKITDDDRICIFQKGISSGKMVSGIISNGTGSHMAENGGESVDLINLDSILENKKVTFIKMDIEGAEMDGLEGAEHIISEQRPKLAISVYHKLDDLWKIPQYIKQLCPAYKIYLRHHTAVAWDTDCYAYID